MTDRITSEPVDRSLDGRPGRKIQLGTYKSAADLRQALLDAGYKISGWGGDILGRINVVSKPTEIEVVEASNAELGYPNGCTVRETYEAERNLGWKLCPAEVGPQYLLQFNLEMGQWRFIATEPIADSVGVLRIFSVERDLGGRWLVGSDGHSEDFYRGSSLWVFRRK